MSESWEAAAAERKALRDRLAAGDPAAVAAAAWVTMFRADDYRNSGFYADQLAIAWLAGRDEGAGQEAVLLRNWHGDRDKICAVRAFADGSLPEGGELQDALLKILEATP